MKTEIKKEPMKEEPKDYCLTCRVPVKQCKGDCTEEERKRNGG